MSPEISLHCLACLHDIIVVSESFEEHLYWLKKVLDNICGTGLIISPDKACFVDPKSAILGIALISGIYNQTLSASFSY